MTLPRHLITLLAYLFLAVAPALAETGQNEVRCYGAVRWLAEGQTSNRKYAPDREVKPQHVIIDITPDFARRSIQGKMTVTFRANVLPAQEIRLDAVEMEIREVTSTLPIRGYQATDDALVVTYASPIPPGQEVSLTVVYAAEPTRGLYFRTPEMGYRDGDTHLFTQGESITSRNWYPCFDSPSDLFTSEVICRVPEGMTVISNGRLVGETRDAATGLKAVHWSQEQPHAAYLITLVAGYFSKIQAQHRDIPLAFLVPQSEAAQASNSFRGTLEMMEFFEKEIGVPYPWPKYYQICVNDFVAGGMENTSATTLTDGTLFDAASENIHVGGNEGLVAHELAHQWFGDLVTCKDWSHLWLNEGFATYYEILWEEHRTGRDAMLHNLYQNLRMITGVSGPHLSVVRRSFGEPDSMFGHLSYQKGGWILHMLRHQLGPDLYRKCVKTFLERHRHASVVTEDLRRIVEEFSGRSYDQFFDQWLYHGGHPELDVTYSWDELARLARISVRQTQKPDTNVLVFNFPLAIRFKGKFGVQDRVIQVSRTDEDFTLALESAPEVVRFDPDLALLAKINYSIPSAMEEAILADRSDVIGRLLVVEQISKRADTRAISRLKQILNSDPFYAVRNEASRGLRRIHKDECLEALLASADQSDARVRLQVSEDIGGFYSEKALQFARGRLENEKNPEIKGALIRQAGGYAKPQLREEMERWLDAKSYRDELAQSALSALRSQDDPAAIPPLMSALERHERDYVSYVFAQGLTTLAYLARNETSKEAVREFLVKRLDSRRRGVKNAALSGLGTLGDTKAIPVLEKFASIAKENRERTVAESALTTLRSGRKPVDDFKNLRQEVLDLQKANREVRKELDDLKKKVKEAETLGSRAQPVPDPKSNGESPKKSKAPEKLQSPKASSRAH